MTRKLAQRIFLFCLIGIVFGILVSEGSYLAVRGGPDRAPKTIELVVPAGTAAKIAAGEAEPSIPADMIFTQGDTLVVKNEDSVNHTLGPVFVPAGATGTLVMSDAANYSYECSFEPSRYFGLDVRPRLSWGARLQGILYVAIPTSVLLILYGLVLMPVKKPGADPEAS